MAPRSKVPKAVQNARVKVENNGESMSPAALKRALTSAELNSLQTSFRAVMSAEAREGYRQLATDDERRSYLCQFILDPEIAKTNGFNKSVAFDEAADVATEGWVTLEELGGPQYLNSRYHADIMAKTLPERPHEVPELAAENVKQYYYVDKKKKRKTGYREEAGTSAKAELKASEYTGVKNDIVSSFEGGKKRKGTPKPRHEETPEEKRLKAANNGRTVACRKLKSVIDKTQNEINMQKGSLPKLADKGFPPEMTTFLEKKVDVFQALVTESQAVYVKEVVVAPELRVDCADRVESSTKETQESLAKLEEAFIAFKKGVSADIKHLVG